MFEAAVARSVMIPTVQEQVRVPQVFVADVPGESKLAKYGEGILKVLGAAGD
jgi:hypothetical protein